MIASVFQIVGGCSRPSGSRGSMESFEPRKAQAPVPAMAEPVLPNCPPAGSPMLQASAPMTGHHRVILSWNASAPSARPEDNAAGYCLYRSKKKDAAKKNATCSDCEQINSVPIIGTGCVDDLVQDRTLYFYVATAISAKGVASSSSNEIPVSIPDHKLSAGSTPVKPYPLCRGTASSTPPR
jgi:hypothetical protein